MHLISKFVREGVREVFATMLSYEAIAKEDLDDNAPHPVQVSGVCGSVSFTGKMNGILYLNFSEKMAKAATGAIMGSDPTSLSLDEISDVVGELTNMVTGNLKSKMTDQGYNCQLTIPSVMAGEKVAIESTQSSIKVCNEFKVSKLDETIRVYVFARLEGMN